MMDDAAAHTRDSDARLACRVGEYPGGVSFNSGEVKL